MTKVHSIKILTKEKYMISKFITKTMVVIFMLMFSSKVIADGHGKIKVGILHSLSGTMAISETTLKDTMLMLI